MSPLAAGSRRFSVSALGATLRNLILRRRNAKETIPPVKKNRKSHPFSDLCSLSIRFRGKWKKTKEMKNSKKMKGISENKMRRRRGRPRKIRNPSDVGVNEVKEVSDFSLTGEASLGFQSIDKSCSNVGTESRYKVSGISMDSNSGKRKRGRPPKIRDSFNQLALNCKSEDKEELVNLENRDGTMVDLSAWANHSEDPYVEELRRFTVGLETKEDVLGFLEQLSGEWVNTGKKKKVVKACDYGGYLPIGWKLMLCVKRKGSYMWLACCRYISPDGRQFATWKEVSMYLQSLLETRSKNQLNCLQSDNKTLGQSVMTNESLLSNSGSIDLPVLSSERNQLFEEAKGAGNGNVAAESLKTSQVKNDDKVTPASDFLNALSNLEAQYGETLMKMIP